MLEPGAGDALDETNVVVVAVSAVTGTADEVLVAYVELPP